MTTQIAASDVITWNGSNVQSTLDTLQLPIVNYAHATPISIGDYSASAEDLGKLLNLLQRHMEATYPEEFL